MSGFHIPKAPNFQAQWEPLLEHLGQEFCRSFQFMASYPTTSGRTIYTYKHKETRRHLNIDNEGVFYRFQEGSGYQQITSDEALAHVHAPAQKLSEHLEAHAVAALGLPKGFKIMAPWDFNHTELQPIRIGQLLVKHGVVPAAALEDPEGYDNELKLEQVNAFIADLQKRLAHVSIFI
jgi:hypothetical protein